MADVAEPALAPGVFGAQPRGHHLEQLTLQRCLLDHAEDCTTGTLRDPWQAHGVIVEDDYQLADIIEIADLNMYESDMVICVMDSDKAACRRGAMTPDWDGCQPMACNNALFSPDHLLAWRREERAIGEAVRREFAISFGSCSFEEPIADLKTLGWL